MSTFTISAGLVDFGRPGGASTWKFFFSSRGGTIQGGSDMLAVNFQPSGGGPLLSGTPVPLTLVASGAEGLGRGGGVLRQPSRVVNPMWFLGTLEVNGTLVVPGVTAGTSAYADAPLTFNGLLHAYAAPPDPITPGPSLASFRIHGGGTGLFRFDPLPQLPQGHVAMTSAVFHSLSSASQAHSAQ